MLINEVKQLVHYIMNKTQHGGYLPPDRWNEIAPAIQFDIFNDNVNKFQATHKVTDTMKPFIKPSTVYTDVNGRFTLPTDYIHIVRASVNNYIKTGDKEYKVRPVSLPFKRSDEVAEILESEIVMADIKNPIAEVMSGYVQVYPEAELKSTPVNLVYLREPTTPVWAYTTVSQRPVFDSGNSTDFELPANLKSALVAKACEYLGINIRENDLVGYMKQFQQEGR